MTQLTFAQQYTCAVMRLDPELYQPAAEVARCEAEVRRLYPLMLAEQRAANLERDK